MRGISKDRLHSEKAVSSGFRTRVRFPPPPPKRKGHPLWVPFFFLAMASGRSARRIFALCAKIQGFIGAPIGGTQNSRPIKPGFDSRLSATTSTARQAPSVTATPCHLPPGGRQPNSITFTHSCHSEKLVLQWIQTDKLEFVN